MNVKATPVINKNPEGSPLMNTVSANEPIGILKVFCKFVEPRNSPDPKTNVNNETGCYRIQAVTGVEELLDSAYGMEGINNEISHTEIFVKELLLTRGKALLTKTLWPAFTSRGKCDAKYIQFTKRCTKELMKFHICADTRHVMDYELVLHVNDYENSRLYRIEVLTLEGRLTIRVS